MEGLRQVAAKVAEYDTPYRQPHPQCLEGTRVTLLSNIYQLLDNRKMSQLIWLHGMAGVGKSAVAFTVAERMRGITVTEQRKIETWLAGTFLFSRKHINCSMTDYFFCDTRIPAWMQFFQRPGGLEQSHPRESCSSRSPTNLFAARWRDSFSNLCGGLSQITRAARVWHSNSPPLTDSDSDTHGQLMVFYSAVVYLHHFQ